MRTVQSCSMNHLSCRQTMIDLTWQIIQTIQTIQTMLQTIWIKMTEGHQFWMMNQCMFWEYPEGTLLITLEMTLDVYLSDWVQIVVKEQHNCEIISLKINFLAFHWWVKKYKKIKFTIWEKCSFSRMMMIVTVMETTTIVFKTTPILNLYIWTIIKQHFNNDWGRLRGETQCFEKEGKLKGNWDSRG